MLGYDAAARSNAARDAEPRGTAARHDRTADGLLLEYERRPGKWRGGFDRELDGIRLRAAEGKGLTEFLQACRLHGAGIFCLVRTSNAGASDVQELTLSDGRRVWQHVARSSASWGEDLVGERGLSSVGAVVGATVRARSPGAPAAPASVLLLPGVGAQGATPADVARAFTSGPASALVDGVALGDLRLPQRHRRLARRRRRRGRSAALRRLGGSGW